MHLPSIAKQPVYAFGHMEKKIIRAIRPLFALGAAVCALLLGFGFYLQYGDGQDPCPLCLLQRGFYFCLWFVFAAAAIHGPKRVGTVLYGTFGLLLAVGGGGNRRPAGLAATPATGSGAKMRTRSVLHAG